MEKKVISRENIVKVDDFMYEIPRSFDAHMRVPARIFMDEGMIDSVVADKSLEQLVNVTSLPGIRTAAYAMPDIHQGYGFPIGGVAGTAINEGGVISPGGIGYDINCGVRLLCSNMTYQEVSPHLEKLADALFSRVPSGVGKGGKIKVTSKELDNYLKEGAGYAVKKGYGVAADLEYCESNGCMENANPELISEHAKKRSLDQLGTLGSGNHFLEIQRVEQIYDAAAAKIFGLQPDAITFMIHCGSRGLGHQTCTDYVRLMISKLAGWGIVLPDRELACAPFFSKEGQDYFNAMAAAANFAWANRHVIAHNVRQMCTDILGQDFALKTVYDVSHNIAKREHHMVDGSSLELLVHRKGATRSFGPHRKEIPFTYQSIGQPVLIPSTMLS